MLKLVKYYLKNYWRLIVLSLAATAFFIGCSSFNYFTQKNDFVKWLSPDETANYTFTKLYAQQDNLAFFEKYNLLAGDIIHPRSFRSDHGWLKPVSFLGMTLLYGKIASLASYKIIPYLTPLLAALGIIFYYLLIKKAFGRRLAFISALLLVSFPVYIYYSARSMFHNVLFIDLLIFGLYFASLMPEKKPGKGIAYAGLAGGFIGLAAITRTSELLWLAPALFVWWIFHIKKIDFSRLIVFIAFFLLALLPAAYWNQILFGSLWQGGYPEMNSSIANIAQAGGDLVTHLTASKSFILTNIDKIKNNVFFFGWHPRQAWTMLNRYFVQMFWWLFWLMAIGFFIFVNKLEKWKLKHWAYLISWGSASLILLLYYGSWGFSDNPNAQSFTIGNSYTRYWLPIYLGAMPFVSLAIVKLTNLFKSRWAALVARAAIILFIFFISLNFVLIGSEEGLIPTAQRQIIAREEFKKIINLTEYNSIIISRYHDKLLFPERKVIVGLFDDPNMIDIYARLAKEVPVYYYNFSYKKNDLTYLNESKLKNYGLKLDLVSNVYQNFSLYKLLWINK